jgi:phenylalanyl-tRNA synthetase beta chain
LHDDRDVDFYDMQSTALSVLSCWGIKQVVLKQCNNAALHPKQSAELYDNDKLIGVVGMLHPSTLAALDLPTAGVMVLNIDAIDVRSMNDATMPSRYPSVARDITVEVRSDVLAGNLQNALERASIPYLKSIQLKDVYRRSEGAVSLTWSLVFQSTEKTLSDKKIEHAMALANACLSV